MELARADSLGGQDGGIPRGADAVAAWLASAEELQAYCERTGQSVWSLRKWRREYADQFGIEIKRRAGAQGVKREVTPASMIPVHLMGSGTSMAGPMTIEVRLGRERSLVLPVDIEVTTITRLISAVEAAR